LNRVSEGDIIFT